MFPFHKTFPSPKEKTPWKNAKTHIIVHHTATGKWTANGVINWLAYRDDFASCHFFIDEDGLAYKFGSPDDILWHAGESRWWNLTDLNKCSLGIEVQWPLWGIGKENFTDAQRRTLRLLTEHLMAVFAIPKENVLRHADITHAYSDKKLHWDGKSKSRKIDPSPDLWRIDRKYWHEYQDSLKPKSI